MLEVRSISISYKEANILNNVSFKLDHNTTLSIVGHSGSGKTTLLKIIAGLEKQNEGTIIYKDKVINNLSPHKRNMIYLYQEPLLFPHINVFDNIAFALKIRKYDRQAIKLKVHKMAELLGIADQLYKKPNELSGGQRQRVSFGRAIIYQPNILLLDEPFSALDYQTRGKMQQLLLNVIEEYKISVIFVTHDVKEALIMGDRMGRIDNGTLTLYNDKHSFIKDPNSGVIDEIGFWKKYMS